MFGPLNLDPEILADLKSIVARRLTPKPIKVRADIEVKCFAYAGIEAVRRALQAGEAVSTPEVPIKVRLVAPPLYVMTTTSTDKALALERMEKAVEAISEKITEEGGDQFTKMAVSPDSAKRLRIGLTCVANSRRRLGGRGAQGAHGQDGEAKYGRRRRRRRRVGGGVDALVQAYFGSGLSLHCIRGQAAQSCMASPVASAAGAQSNPNGRPHASHEGAPAGLYNVQSGQLIPPPTNAVPPNPALLSLPVPPPLPSPLD